MNPDLVEILCDPVDGSKLELRDAKYDSHGRVCEGVLASKGGRSYQVRNGVPRFAQLSQQIAVDSFGNEWNTFNFDRFKQNWLEHTVRNTFGSPSVFRDKVIVDAGAGSGMQSRWMSEAGARRVISLELSHSVDGIMKQNLHDLPNVDIVQCSIDQPPLRAGSINGMVICHNVIQHTPSVERTAEALWKLVAQGGEFVFNCYMLRTENRIWMLRYRFYQTLRKLLSKRSFSFVRAYAHAMAVLRFVPLLGELLERSLMLVRGDVPRGPKYFRRCYHATVLNTFDWYGGHGYQHHKTETELRLLVSSLQPEPRYVMNIDRYFQFPQPPGCALRLRR